MALKHRVWVEVDLSKLVSNFHKIASAVRPARVIAVLKANAYGLGVAPFAEALTRTRVDTFGVAEPFEALALREKEGSVPIQILSSILPDEVESMVASHITLPVTDWTMAQHINQVASRLHEKARVHIKLDTGMGRLGILAQDALETIPQIKSLPNLICEGIFSHCPMAYDPENPFTQDQISRFLSIIQACAEKGIAFEKIHLAASDAINNFPRCTQPPFTHVRTGINLHGSFDPYGRKTLNVESVLTLKTRVAQVRLLPAGTTLGYGRTWCLNRSTRVATISAGYADGLPLALTNCGHVLIHDTPCPVIGRISMDYTTVDVSAVSHVEAGDEVICLGASASHQITPDDWGALKHTHAYEIICSLGSRVSRVVKPIGPSPSVMFSPTKSDEGS